MKKFFLIAALCTLPCALCTKYYALCTITAAYHPVTLQRDITQAQPMAGLVLWSENDKMATLQNTISLEFRYCMPCKVVLGKNSDGTIRYDWSSFEATLNDVASRNHQTVVRFWYEYPSNKDVNSTKGTTAVPAYIKALDGYTETYSKNPGGDGPTYYADWSNGELQWFNKQFFRDFAARYGNDPRIAFLEVGFGHWAEYHIYGTTLSLGHNFPSKAYQSEFFQHLDTIMPIPWLCSVDVSDDSYSPLMNDAAMQACTFGLFDDSFMHSEHDYSQGEGWNEQCWVNADSTRWRQGVCGGEISYYEYPYDQYNFLNPAGMYGVKWENACRKYHISFMNCNDAAEGPYGTAAHFLRGSLACGYAFRITALETDGASTRITIMNEGVAPIYRDAYLKLGSTQDTQSLVGLLPGQSRTVTLAGNGDTESLSIVSPHILPTQQISFRANLQGTTPVPEHESRVESVKCMVNGRLVIRRGNRTYNALGF